MAEYPAKPETTKSEGTKESKLEALQKKINELVEEREKLIRGDK